MYFGQLLLVRWQELSFLKSAVVSQVAGTREISPNAAFMKMKFDKASFLKQLLLLLFY